MSLFDLANASETCDIGHQQLVAFLEVDFCGGLQIDSLAWYVLK